MDTTLIHSLLVNIHFDVKTLWHLTPSSSEAMFILCQAFCNYLLLVLIISTIYHSRSYINQDIYSPLFNYIVLLQNDNFYCYTEQLNECSISCSILNHLSGSYQLTQMGRENLEIFNVYYRQSYLYSDIEQNDFTMRISLKRQICKSIM